MIPIMPTISRSVLNRIIATNAPKPAEGNVEMMVRGWNQALIQHSQDDIDGREALCADQNRLIGKSFLIGLRRAGKLARDVGGQPHIHFRAVNRVYGIAQ